MKAVFSITELADCGDFTRVKAQGKFCGSASWQPEAMITFEAPPHLAKSYTIGRFLTVTIKPRGKP